MSLFSSFGEPNLLQILQDPDGNRPPLVWQSEQRKHNPVRFFFIAEHLSPRREVKASPHAPELLTALPKPFKYRQEGLTSRRLNQSFKMGQFSEQKFLGFSLDIS